MSSDLTKVNLFLTTALLVLVVDLCALDRRKRDTMSDEFLEYSRLQRRRAQHVQLRSRRRYEEHRQELETILSPLPEYQSTEKKPERYFYSSNSINSNEHDIRNRRSFDVESPVPACPSDVTWQRLSSAIDLTGVTVTLVQHPTAQLFLIVRCKHHNCCLGIDNRRPT
ncbi:uncharacterized protein LOC106057572 isoform X2 [Biomphalaria glabrata]|uniref:Uncharacterized protein LOC106057572 isoform X2 n=1 Tax=Biomphalaria glabrata TaxID=6526 RepID=A0A9W3ALE7_BIOGL|nr:uncharacterized protein LOC106057572 isoform X2 [Biomphalaria glabrata]